LTSRLRHAAALVKIPYMRGYVGLTDQAWYEFLRVRPDIGEANFWRPSPTRFKAIDPGEPFFFKLKGAHKDAIAGYGFFARDAVLPVWQAWDVFEHANGTRDVHELMSRLGRLSSRADRFRDMTAAIGCTALADTVFFAPDEWAAAPKDWPRSGVQKGKTYDLAVGEGRRVWLDCLERSARSQGSEAAWASEALARERTGKPILIAPRLGQRSFRVAVMDAYGWQCAVTTEHSRPAVEAAHIRPWGDGGEHAVSNGIPLRRDIHRLFDLGYVTVRPDLTFAVSRRLKDEFANGRAYYALSGCRIQTPPREEHLPSRELLEWHGEAVFQAA
jgi:putative restriction endonuclease